MVILVVCFGNQYKHCWSTLPFMIADASIHLLHPTLMKTSLGFTSWMIVAPISSTVSLVGRVEATQSLEHTSLPSLVPYNMTKFRTYQSSFLNLFDVFRLPRTVNNKGLQHTHSKCKYLHNRACSAALSQ